MAGVPVQAKPQALCPMADKMHMQQMDMQGMKDCKGCDKMAKHESKKNDCCEDAACAAKCTAMNGGVSMNLSRAKTDLPRIGTQALPHDDADSIVASRQLNTQERPPKSLS